MADASMRIVFVSYEYPPTFGGGIGTYVAAMSRILAQRGHRVTVVTVTEEGLPRREMGADGLEVVRLPAPRGLPARAEPLLTLEYWEARSEGVAAYLSKLVRAERVDVIEFADYRGEGLSFLAARRGMAGLAHHGPRCIVRLHTPLMVLNRYNRGRARYVLQEAFENEALGMADALVSPSAALAREVAGLLPEVGLVELLPYPADPMVLRLAEGGGSQIANGKAANGRAAKQQVGGEREVGGRGTPPVGNDVLYVGRLEERKGVEALMAAAPRILAACPGAKLRLVGADTEYGAGEPSMRARLERGLERMLPRELAQRVVFEDALPREELLARYRSARVCVFPSLFENFPNVCLEAMALGCVVVGSDNSGMAEMIESGVSGVIARAGDAADLAERVASAWGMSEGARRAMGESARRRVRDAYHPEVIAAAWERVCGGEEIANRKAANSKAAEQQIGEERAGGGARVAVVIPCFNHGKFVGEAVASARAQTWPDVEVVVVDDGSTDAATVRALADLARQGTRVIRRENGGLAAARNTGVRATGAEFFVPLDADDMLEPAFIERLIAPLLRDETLGYCYCHAAYFGASRDVWPCPPYDGPTLLVANLSVATAVVRRRAFDLAGGYSEDMRGGFEDWDLWLGLLGVGYRGRCVAEPLFRYRKHEGGSMLSETQRRRPELIRRMVAHHRALYAMNMEGALSEKDTMFFRSHMESWEARQELARVLGGVLGGGGSVPAGHASGAVPEVVVRAREELEAILGSRAWRAMARLKGNAVYKKLARARWGEGWERGMELPADPCVGLEQVKGTRSYRVIRVVKGSGVYRWYAERNG